MSHRPGEQGHLVRPESVSRLAGRHLSKENGNRFSYRGEIVRQETIQLIQRVSRQPPRLFVTCSPTIQVNIDNGQASHDQR